MHPYIRTCIHTDIQTYRHTDIQIYRYTDIRTYRHTDRQTEKQKNRKTEKLKKQHRSHELGYLLSVQKCPDHQIDHEKCFLRAPAQRNAAFLMTLVENRVPSLPPPNWVTTRSKVQKLRLFSNRPVIMRKSRPKIINQTNDSPENVGYSRSIHMPAALPFTVEDLNKGITTEFTFTNSNHGLASTAFVSLTHTVQH